MILQPYDLDFSLLNEDSLETLIEKASRELMDDEASDRCLTQDPFLSFDADIVEKIPAPAENPQIPESVLTLLLPFPVKLSALEQILQSEMYFSLITHKISFNMMVHILIQLAGAQSLMTLVRFFSTDQLSLFRECGFNTDQLFRITAQPLGFENIQLLQRVLEAHHSPERAAFDRMRIDGITTEEITDVLAQPLGYKNFKKLLASWTVGHSELGSWHTLQVADYSPNELFHIVAQPMGFYYFNALTLLVDVTTKNAVQTLLFLEKGPLKTLVLKKGALPQIKIALEILKKEPSINQMRLFSFLDQNLSHDAEGRIEKMPLEKLMACIQNPRKQKQSTIPHDAMATHSDDKSFKNKRFKKIARDAFVDPDFSSHVDPYAYAFSTDNAAHQQALWQHLRNPRPPSSTLLYALDSVAHSFTKRVVLPAREADTNREFRNRLSFSPTSQGTDPNLPVIWNTNVDEQQLFREALFGTGSIYDDLLISLYKLSRNAHSQQSLESRLNTDNFRQKLKEPPYFNLFFEELLERRPENAGKDANKSALFWLSAGAKGRQILEIILNNDTFQQKLTEPASFNLFFEALLARDTRIDHPNWNMSALYCLSHYSEGIKILQNILKTELFQNKLQNPVFFDLFFNALLAKRNGMDQKHANESPLYCLSATPERPKILEDILKNETFHQKLQEPAFARLFCEALLARKTNHAAANNPNTSALYMLSDNDNFHTILTKPALIQALLEHADFFNTLLATIPITNTNTYNTSCLYFLISKLPQYQDWLLTIFSHQVFQTWIENPINIKNMIQTMSAMSRTTQCIFSILFSKSTSGKTIFQKLMSYPAIHQAFFDQFQISRQAQAIWMSRLDTDVTFLLWKALYQSQHLSLLQHTNLRALFETQQIQQLIHMQQIKPEWFLFMAATQPQYDAQLIAFFLAQDNISVWATNVARHSLYHLVDGLVIIEADKIQLKNQLHCTIQQQTERHAKKNVCVQLHEAPSLQAEQEPSTAFSLPVEPPQEDTGIQKVRACIQWIEEQPALGIYHAAFRTLSTNAAITNLQDYTQLLSLLQRICSAMQHAIVTNTTLVFYDEWHDSLGKCITGVYSCLNHIYAKIANIHPFIDYFENSIQTNIAYFNRLFNTSTNLEVHAPQALTQTCLSRPLQSFPMYDPYLLAWSPIQQHWVAQNAAERLLHSEDYLYEQMVESFLDIVADGLWKKDTSGNPQAVTELHIEDLIETHPLMVAKELLNNTSLCPKLLSTSDFLAFLLADENRTQETIDGIISVTGWITDIHSQHIHEQLKSKMQTLFSNWLDANGQAGIPRKKIVHTMSELLWQYLTQENSNCFIAALLKKLHHASDAAALIKYCLMSHHSEAHLIKWERFFEPLCVKSLVSLFSLLIANPFYTQWLFGFEIDAQRHKPPNQDQASSMYLEFKSTLNTPRFAQDFMQDANLKTVRDKALESALIQPGTLYFWLYYLQQDPLRLNLFQAIVKFIYKHPKGLSNHDSLLPLLLSMQRSSTVSLTDKALVRSFLQDRMDEQLKQNHRAYWQTSCHLFDSPEKMAERTQQHIAQHPWLLDPAQHDPTTDMARCFLLNRETVTNLTTEILGQFGLFAAAATPSASTPIPEDAASPHPHEI